MAKKLNETDVDYDIGYKKPPSHSRFPKGHSGNPRGRPKGKRNLGYILLDALNEKVVITENGRRKVITKSEVMLKQLVNKAASGDVVSIKLLIAMYPMVASILDENNAKPLNAEAEALLLEHIKRKLLSKSQHNPENNEPHEGNNNE